MRVRLEICSAVIWCTEHSLSCSFSHSWAMENVMKCVRVSHVKIACNFIYMFCWLKRACMKLEMVEDKNVIWQNKCYIKTFIVGWIAWHFPWACTTSVNMRKEIARPEKCIAEKGKEFSFKMQIFILKIVLVLKCISEHLQRKLYNSLTV